MASATNPPKGAANYKPDPFTLHWRNLGYSVALSCVYWMINDQGLRTKAAGRSPSILRYAHESQDRSCKEDQVETPLTKPSELSVDYEW